MKVYDIYECGHMSKIYSKFDSTIELRIKMLPIPCICEKCGKHTYTIDIVSEKQMNRDKKIKYLLK
jgi:hypothetical protein